MLIRQNRITTGKGELSGMASTVVLDLEMNPIAKEHKEIHAELHHEVIEFGAIRLNDRLEVDARFSCFVKPRYNETITPQIIALTGIHTEDVADAVFFEEAFQAFRAWTGTERCDIFCWSDNDYNQLKMECRFKHVQLPKNYRFINLQTEFAQALNLPKSMYQIGLEHARLYIGVESQDFHRALSDAEMAGDLLRSMRTGELQRLAQLNRELFWESSEMVSSLADSLDEETLKKLRSAAG